MRLVLTNCTPAEASALARTLVEEGLAACVNLLPGVHSVYRWRGELCEERETTLMIKTPLSKVDALRDRLVALHSYELPEVLVLTVDCDASLGDYVAWVRALGS